MLYRYTDHGFLWELAHMVVVRDKNYHSGLAIQKLQNAGFNLAEPSCCPQPEVLGQLPDPESVVKEINSRYKLLDQSTKTLDYLACRGKGRSRSRLC